MEKNKDINNKEKIIKYIQEYFEQQEDILFAYLYGSFVNQDRYRDIDLAVYSKNPELMKLGSMRTDLVRHTNMEIDLCYLNGLPNTNPSFAYEIVTTGELVHNDTPDRHDEYKVKAFLAYFDTAPLRDRMNKAFINRLRSNNFGERDYA